MDLKDDLVACVAAHETVCTSHQLAGDEGEEDEIYPLVPHVKTESGESRRRVILDFVHLFGCHEFPELDVLAFDVFTDLGAYLQCLGRDTAARHIR